MSVCQLLYINSVSRDKFNYPLAYFQSNTDWCWFEPIPLTINDATFTVTVSDLLISLYHCHWCYSETGAILTDVTDINLSLMPLSLSLMSICHWCHSHCHWCHSVTDANFIVTDVTLSRMLFSLSLMSLCTGHSALLLISLYDSQWIYWVKLMYSICITSWIK